MLNPSPSRAASVQFVIVLLSCIAILGALAPISLHAQALEQYQFAGAWGGGQPGETPPTPDAVEAQFAFFGNGMMSSPRKIARDAAGNVYVVDTGNHRVRKYDADGGFITAFGSFGTSPGRLNAPQGVAVDSAGNIFVADSANNRIQKFNNAGTFLLQWGGSGSALGMPDEIGCHPGGDRRRQA